MIRDRAKTDSQKVESKSSVMCPFKHRLIHSTFIVRTLSDSLKTVIFSYLLKSILSGVNTAEGV